MTKCRREFVALLASAAFIPIAGVAAPASAQAPSEWKVGALFPFSGPLAFLGQETFRGAEIASRIINESGGINGTKIVWEKADAGSPAQARSEAERLANAGIKVVVGTNASGLAMAASQVLEQQKVIFWEPGSAVEELTTRGYKYTFRTVPPGSEWAHTLADYAVDKVAPALGKTKETVRIAVKYEDGAFGNSISKYLVDRLKSKGVTVVASESYSARATDLSSLVLKLKEAKPDIILSTDYPNDAILFARQSKELGLPTKAVLGWAGIAFPKFRQDLGDYAEGMMSINMLMDLDPARLPPETRQVREKFREYYKKDTGSEPPAFTAVGFDSAWALFKYVLPKAGKNDADAIREAAMATDLPEGALTMGWGLKFSTPSGDSKHLGQNLRAVVGVTQWQDGKLVLVWPERFASGSLRAPK
ncbi:MAG: ABC transporter substrate-binding protein [Alphaproteobacteria bacterium]